MYTLNDVFKNMLLQNRGVFYVLGSEMPWGQMLQGLGSLDIVFHYRYGNRYISDFLNHFITQDGLFNTFLQITFRNAVSAVYIDTWEKMWNTLNFVYNPIENYSMTESEETEETKSENKRYDRNLKSENTAGITTETETDISAFNSPTLSNAGKETVTPSGKDTTDETGYTEEENGEETGINRTLTRTGNIGTVTAQDMIKQEREIQKWNYFKDYVFEDLKELLTLKIY